jgi:peptidoglycan hydrolase CwlO-like protein
MFGIKVMDNSMKLLVIILCIIIGASVVSAFIFDGKRDSDREMQQLQQKYDSIESVISAYRGHLIITAKRSDSLRTTNTILVGEMEKLMSKVETIKTAHEKINLFIDTASMATHLQYFADQTDSDR